MKTFLLRDEENHAIGFEIRSGFLWSGALKRLISLVGGEPQGAESARVSDREGDVRLNFVFDGTEFEVWEPYGDSSRYWVGPTHFETSVESKVLAAEERFRKVRFSTLRRLVGFAI